LPENIITDFVHRYELLKPLRLVNWMFLRLQVQNIRNKIDSVGSLGRATPKPQTNNSVYCAAGIGSKKAGA
jgi:hypothetical protein